jgi:molybdopterin-containing oxidoreductase family iron-sulfur binding subunit
MNERGFLDILSRKSCTRRQILKLLGIGAGGLLLGNSPRVLEAAFGSEGEAQSGKSIWYAPPPNPKARYAMVIDINACIGCRKCVYACLKENNIGRRSGITYIQVLAMEKGSIDLDRSDLYYKEGAQPDRWYMPIQCMQCENPPCVQSCPVTATWRESDGIVVIDYKKCIGCRNCMIACPYWARHFNWNEPFVPKEEVNPDVPIRPTGVVEKCTFCIHRVRRGKTTRCVEACPVQARKFGDLNDPNSSVSQLLRTRRVFRLKEDLGTEPRIWYVG